MIADPDELQDALLCPICMDIPKNKVFQCREGHHVCEECYAQLQICPQCQLRFEDPPTRNLVAEALLDKVKIDLDCPYKYLGCAVKVNNRKSLREHTRCCRLGPSVCPCKGLGFNNCTFQMNGGTTVEEALQHFETAHGAVKMDSNSIVIEFANYANLSGGTKLIILNKKDQGYAFLIEARHVGRNPQRTNWLPFYFQYPTLGHSSDLNASDLSRMFEVRYDVKGEPNPSIFQSQNVAWDILKYTDQASFNSVCPRHMLNSDVLKYVENPYQSLFLCVQARKVGCALDNVGQAQFILTQSEMKENAASDVPESHRECMTLRPLLTQPRRSVQRMSRAAPTIPSSGSPSGSFSFLSTGSGSSSQITSQAPFAMPPGSFGFQYAPNPAAATSTNLQNVFGALSNAFPGFSFSGPAPTRSTFQTTTQPPPMGWSFQTQAPLRNSTDGSFRFGNVPNTPGFGGFGTQNPLPPASNGSRTSTFSFGLPNGNANTSSPGGLQNPLPTASNGSRTSTFSFGRSNANANITSSLGGLQTPAPPSAPTGATTSHPQFRFGSPTSGGSNGNASTTNSPSSAPPSSGGFNFGFGNFI